MPKTVWTRLTSTCLLSSRLYFFSRFFAANMHPVLRFISFGVAGTAKRRGTLLGVWSDATRSGAFFSDVMVNAHLNSQIERMTKAFVVLTGLCTFSCKNDLFDVICPGDGCPPSSFKLHTNNILCCVLLHLSHAENLPPA